MKIHVKLVSPVIKTISEAKPLGILHLVGGGQLEWYKELESGSVAKISINITDETVIQTRKEEKMIRVQEGKTTLIILLSQVDHMKIVTDYVMMHKSKSKTKTISKSLTMEEKGKISLISFSSGY